MSKTIRRLGVLLLVMALCLGASAMTNFVSIDTRFERPVIFTSNVLALAPVVSSNSITATNINAGFGGFADLSATNAYLENAYAADLDAGSISAEYFIEAPQVRVTGSLDAMEALSQYHRLSYYSVESWSITPIYLYYVGYQTRSVPLSLLTPGYFHYTVVTNMPDLNTNSAAGWILPTTHGVGPAYTNEWFVSCGIVITNWPETARFYAGMTLIMDVNSHSTTPEENDAMWRGLGVRVKGSEIQLVARTNSPSVAGMPMVLGVIGDVSTNILVPIYLTMYKPLGDSVPVQLKLYRYGTNWFTTNVTLPFLPHNRVGVAQYFVSTTTNSWCIGPMHLIWRQ